MNNSIPIRTRHLFQELDELLILKLRSLLPQQWDASTLAGKWSVKDLAAHLLDGNLRALAMIRDGYFGENPGPINSYQDLVTFLNRLNADWVTATRRLSPKVLISLLESSGREYRSLIKSLKPMEKAIFSVAWAGEEESLNWFHIAREYTEKWHHTQQIFTAIDPTDQTLLSKRLYLPYLETSMRALPHQYSEVKAPKGTLVKIRIDGQFTQTWWLKREEKQWQLLPFSRIAPKVHIHIPGNLAWRIFTKGLSYENARNSVQVTGEEDLARPILTLLAVMA